MKKYKKSYHQNPRAPILRLWARVLYTMNSINFEVVLSMKVTFRILLFYIFTYALICHTHSVAFCAVDLGVKTGQVTGLPIPRYVSLKSNEINLRAGPGMQYPIRYIYRCTGYPMKVVAEFEHWRLLRDLNDVEGWVHKSLISGRSNVVIKGNYIKKTLPYSVPKNEAIIFNFPNEDSYPVVRVEFGVVAMLKKCQDEWCYIEVERIYRGWIRKENLYGAFLN
ncbi:MAG: SH3 domain-containing protein [Candidatus Lariskella arthropodorum]